MSSTTNTPGQLALVMILAGGFLATLGLIIFMDLPPGSKDLAEIMVGVLGSNLTNVVQHYFRPQETSNKDQGPGTPLSTPGAGNSAETPV